MFLGLLFRDGLGRFRFTCFWVSVSYRSAGDVLRGSFAFFMEAFVCFKDFVVVIFLTFYYFIFFRFFVLNI